MCPVKFDVYDFILIILANLQESSDSLWQPFVESGRLRKSSVAVFLFNADKTYIPAREFE